MMSITMLFATLIALSHSYTPQTSLRTPLRTQIQPFKTSDSAMTRAELFKKSLTISLASAVATTAFTTTPNIANAAPEIFTTDKGVKYAITKK
jgi:hypothetical protein